MITDKQRQRDYEYEADYSPKAATQQNSGQIF